MDEYKKAWDQTEQVPGMDVADPVAEDSKAMAAAFDEPEEEVVEEKPKFKKFSEAFRHHRAKGDKTFEWNGKMYTTDLKKTASKTRVAKNKPDVAMGNEGRREAAPAAQAVSAAQAAKPKGHGMNLFALARERNAEMAKRPMAPSIEQIRAENRRKAQ